MAARRSGARRIVLLGFATGGALAALVAAARRDIAGLMLFEPAIIGRSHIRQLILEGDLQRGASMPRELGLEIRENRFDASKVSADRRLRPARARAAGRHEGRDLRARRKQGGRRLREAPGVARGVEATRGGFDGLRCWCTRSMLDERALGDFTPADRLAQGNGAAGAAVEAAIGLPVVVLQPPGCIDMPLKFGPENRLFGMLCRPERGTPRTWC